MAELGVGMMWSFGLCFLLTPRARTLAARVGLVDKPDGLRKLHGQCIPVAGGPVILLSLIVAFLAALLVQGPIRTEAATAAARLSGFVMAAIIICVVGVFDDLGRLRGRDKLMGQSVAIAAVIVAGVRIDSVRLLYVSLDLGIWSLPFTVFFLLGAINSLNLLDGMDGVLTSIAFLLCLALGSVALLAGKQLTAYLACATAAALLAFLRYNFPPATVFLGDSGSLLIGLIVAVLAIDCSMDLGSRRMSLAAPLALFSLPILDTAAAILRRKLTGRSIYNTDRSHLHHCLLRRFGDPRLVLFVTSFCCLALSAGILAGQMLGREWLMILASFAVITALIATRLFGFTELQMVLQRVRALGKSLVRMPHADEPRQLELRMHGNVDWRELWLRILDWEEALQLCRLRLDVNAPALGECYHARWDRGLVATEEEEVLWRAQIPLTLRGCPIGRLEINGRRGDKSLGEKIAILAKVVQDFEQNVSLLADRAAKHQGAVMMTLATAPDSRINEVVELQRANL